MNAYREDKKIFHFQLLPVNASMTLLYYLTHLVLALALGFASPTRAESEPHTIDESASSIFDLLKGKPLSMETLVSMMRAQDIVLLGERHDHPAHHLARAQLIQSLACAKCSIIAEHLPAGHQVLFSDSLLGALESAGFDAKGWNWPLHEPLFRAIQLQNITLLGGNISHTLTSDIFRRGKDAIPIDLLKEYNSSPLSDISRKKLDQDLKDGHCGQLSDQFLPPMRLIQRIKDASFAQLLADHTPSLFIAGNGHVRKDYGVPQILAAIAPHLKILSIGFIEQDDWTPESQHILGDLYDVVWISKNNPRSDPCKDFSAPHLKN